MLEIGKSQTRCRQTSKYTQMAVENKTIYYLLSTRTIERSSQLAKLQNMEKVIISFIERLDRNNEFQEKVVILLTNFLSL